MTPWTIAHQASLSITNSQSLLKLMSLKSVMPSNHLILCYPFSCCLQSCPASQSFFFNESGLLIRQPKYWSFSFSISPSKEYSERISFRIDWFDLLAVQGTLESSPAPQFKSINILALKYGSEDFPPVAASGGCSPVQGAGFSLPCFLLWSVGSRASGLP